MPGKSLSVVVPVYNSRETLPELVQRLRQVLEVRGGDFEIVLVDDGSRDGSAELVRELAGRDPRVVAVNLLRNFGQHNALLCGIRAARHELLATIDDDLQNPPEELPRMLARLEEGFDVVYGTPEKEQHGLLRDLASRITKLALQTAMGAETARSVSSFRVFRAELRKAFAGFEGPYVSVDVLLTWGTDRFAAVPVRHERRRAGVSHYTLGKLLTHALNMATGFSTLPLRIASGIGFLFTLFGAGVLAYVVGRTLLQGTTVPGFAFLASTIAIFAGAQLLALGIIGEYLARMHFRSMKKPAYVARDERGE